MGGKEVAVVAAVLSLLYCCRGVQAQSSAGPSALPFTTPRSCSEAGEIFQSGNLSCVQCAADHSEPSTDGTFVVR